MKFRIQLLLAIGASAIVMSVVDCALEGAHSEVWSEIDGLEMKYSMHHDDLLGAKGSELTLSSNKHPQEAPAQQVTSSKEPAESQLDQEVDGQSGERAAPDADADSNSNQPASYNRQNEQPPTYKSISEQLEHDEQQSTGPQSDETSADVGDSNDAEQRASPGFRMPGRLFKEAVKMRDFGEQAANLNEDQGGNQAAGGEEPAPEQSTRKLLPSSGSQVPAAQSDEFPSSDANSNEGNDDDEQSERGDSSWGQQERRASTRNTAKSSPVADLDRASAVKRVQPSRVLSQEEPRSQSSDESDQADEEKPTPSKPVRQELRHGLQRRPLGQSSPQKATKPLTYFANVPGRLQPEVSGRFRNTMSSDEQSSVAPDSVRDDFISPGHFPGSMAHLTQAASETAQGIRLDSSATPSLIVETKLDTKATNATSTVAPAPLPPSVTPQPEASPESQQIMAPILITTTTPQPQTTAESAQQTGAGGQRRFKQKRLQLVS